MPVIRLSLVKKLAGKVRLAGLIVATFSTVPAWAAITVTDDIGRSVTLQKPARRIISLAPHVTDLLYAAGAGAYLVGVSEFSDYPPAARQIRSVGSATALDLERIVLLKPDLVVAWDSGNSAGQLGRLKNLGIAVFASEPRDFAMIAANIERLAKLAGQDAAGQAAASAFRTRLQAITAAYAQRPPVRIFYQIWDAPLMTLNDSHMVSSVIRMCGGRNIFGNLPTLTPTVGFEAVIQTDPEVIIAGTGEESNAVARWQRFPKLTAVERGNLFTLNPDLLTRAGPRILDGAEALCKQLEEARKKRR